jgi:hypothetical protein
MDDPPSKVLKTFFQEIRFRGRCYNPTRMNAARRTLGCWVLSVFLERGCDPTTARMPRTVRRIRTLSPREMAELNPLAGMLVAATNLRRFPRRRRARP